LKITFQTFCHVFLVGRKRLQNYEFQGAGWTMRAILEAAYLSVEVFKRM
jgi:hypothetical protein